MTVPYMNELRPTPRLLLGPGPSTVHPRVLQAMTLPIVGHLDPEFFQVMDDVSEMLRSIYHTANPMTFPISSTGTGGMEAACANILEHGDTMVVCRNGYFGHRLADVAERCGAETHVVDSPWGQPVDAGALSRTLDRLPRVKAVGVVHGETSTGVLNDLPEIIELAHRHGALVIVDAVTSLGGHEMRMDEWDIDVCYSGSQKCLGAPPGLAPISFGPRAMEVVNSRESRIQSFYFSLKELETYWSGTRAYHHTAPISMNYSLREALRMVMEEGIEDRIRRHSRVASVLWAGLEALGIGVLAEPSHRLNPLTAAVIPDGVDDAATRRSLLEEHNIEIGGGLGDLRGKVWRIGLMGESARETNVFALLSALEVVLSGQGYEVARGSSLAAAQRALASFQETASQQAAS